ncbi:MAG: hypothetical protein GX994_05125 [Firmicutes bacterium]|nr:hypothetical protein [Bacillota bacterium]
MTLSLINNSKVNAKDFVIKETGGVLMNDDLRKLVIASWQKRKQEEIIPQF